MEFSVKTFIVGEVFRQLQLAIICLKQLIIALSEFIEVININDYDFTANPEIWDYRKLEGLSETMSEEDIKLIEEVESQLKGFG